MSGLDNPRGLAFGPEGGLYVAEAGRGGPASGLCYASVDPDVGFRCYGATGAISRYWHVTQERVVTGLPSLENPTFAGPASGPQHVSFHGGGGMYVTIGFGGGHRTRGPSSCRASARASAAPEDRAERRIVPGEAPAPSVGEILRMAP